MRHLALPACCMPKPVRHRCTAEIFGLTSLSQRNTELGSRLHPNEDIGHSSHGLLGGDPTLCCVFSSAQQMNVIRSTGSCRGHAADHSYHCCRRLASSSASWFAATISKVHGAKLQHSRLVPCPHAQAQQAEPSKSRHREQAEHKPFSICRRRKARFAEPQFSPRTFSRQPSSRPQSALRSATVNICHDGPAAHGSEKSSRWSEHGVDMVRMARSLPMCRSARSR